jgi:hypothetical protein
VQRAPSIKEARGADFQHNDRQAAEFKLNSHGRCCYGVSNLVVKHGQNNEAIS